MTDRAERWELPERTRLCSSSLCTRYAVIVKVTPQGRIGKRAGRVRRFWLCGIHADMQDAPLPSRLVRDPGAPRD